MASQELSLTPDAESRIHALLAEALTVPPDSLSIGERHVLNADTETRLRFNTPTPVHVWCLRLALQIAQSPSMWVEVELFQWVVDDEWELLELQPCSKPAP